MDSETKNVTVCICTFRRPAMLARLLRELALQVTEGVFEYSIVVVDNDPTQSARPVVERFMALSSISMSYCVEPEQGIARARNRALANARGDFVAFIDDDEFPTDRWLLSLFRSCDRPEVDGVLGPVISKFSAGVPRWVVDGGFYDRPEHESGATLRWEQTRTGNVLMKSGLVREDSTPFRVDCIEGSDQEFFKRMSQRGHTFIWCREAIVYEEVPPARWTRSFVVRRALSRGAFSVINHGFALPLIMRSLIATPLYILALPVMMLLGQGRLMSCVSSISYHLGRLMASIGIEPTTNSYVSE